MQYMGSSPTLRAGLGWGLSGLQIKGPFVGPLDRNGTLEERTPTKTQTTHIDRVGAKSQM